MAAAIRPLFVVAGVGAGTGTGAQTARRFSKAGYSIALIARNKDSIDSLASEINSDGGNATSFPVSAYSPAEIKKVFTSIDTKYPATENYAYKTALFNAGGGVWKPFLQTTDEDLTRTLNDTFLAGWSFAQEAVARLQKSPDDPETRKGTLIFTGATASTRGNVVTSAVSASKHALRALSQSLAKEFGKEGIHVSHAIIDGAIANNNKTTLGAAPAYGISPDAIAQAYFYLAHQNKLAWTWEMDMRTSTEKW